MNDLLDTSIAGVNRLIILFVGAVKKYLIRNCGEGFDFQLKEHK